MTLTLSIGSLLGFIALILRGADALYGPLVAASAGRRRYHVPGR